MLFAVLAVLALGAPAVAASLDVSPASVAPGGSVTVSGSVAGGCATGDQVTLISKAFGPGHEFAGQPAVITTATASGSFSVTTQIPTTRAPGTYTVSGRCGGGNFGAKSITVTSSGGLPFTGAEAWAIAMFGLILTGAGIALRRGIRVQ